MRLAGSGVELWSGYELITVSPPGGLRPTDRFSAATLVSPDCSSVLVLGGVQGHIIGGVFLSDVWRFDVKSRTWEQLPEDLGWEPRRGALVVAVPASKPGGSSRLLLLGGVGQAGNLCRDVWSADASEGWRPTKWQQLCGAAPWKELQCATWVSRLRPAWPNDKEGSWLYVFDAAGVVYRSPDCGETWYQVGTKLPFGDLSDPIAFVLAPTPCQGAADLVAVTTGSQVWASPDGGRSWLQQCHGPGGPGSRSQVTGVAGDGDLLVASRSRDSSQLSIWQLERKPPPAWASAFNLSHGERMWPLVWKRLISKVSLNPTFSQVNQLVAAGRRMWAGNEEEPGAVLVEFNAIDEFTVWRASPVAVNSHRRMLKRLGRSQAMIEPDIWDRHIIDALLPAMDSTWVPEVLASHLVQPEESAAVDEEENIWDYWH